MAKDLIQYYVLGGMNLKIDYFCAWYAVDITSGGVFVGLSGAPPLVDFLQSVLRTYLPSAAS